MIADFRSLAVLIPLTVALDLLWLGVIARGAYRSLLGGFMREAPVWPSAIAVYVLIPLGLSLFVLPRAGGSPATAGAYGALFGLVLYGTYEFTNHALVRGWPFKAVLLDVAWGMVLCAVVSAAAVWGAGWRG